jgi:hypothetical protein
MRYTEDMNKELSESDSEVYEKIANVLSRHAIGYRGDDTMMKGDLLEIIVGEAAIRVDEFLWHSWAGLRFKNGDEYHGPVYDMHTTSRNQYAGPRVCMCSKCQPVDAKSMN